APPDSRPEIPAKAYKAKAATAPRTKTKVLLLMCLKAK
ncbi:putative lipoprotein, partial [Vibrio parahaemolyticus EKP-021]